MDVAPWLLLVFLVTIALITVIALVLNPNMRVGIKLGPAEWTIDTSRPGWKREPSPSRPIGANTSSQTTASASCHAWLAAKMPDKIEWKYCLDGHQQVYLGRHVSNDIQLLDQSADNRHAVIYLKEGRYRINNLSSRGTWVNNRSISWQNLGNGNKIRLGRTELVFRQHPDNRGTTSQQNQKSSRS